MNNIGLELKTKREENGVSIDEAALDLKIRPSQIMSLEEGKKDDFPDVLFLKNFIRDYAKYLGLDSEKMVDKFNEFLFDFTSKIPVDAIEQAKKEKRDDKKIGSPYTAPIDNKFKISRFLIGVIVAIVVIVIGYVVISNLSSRNDFNDNDITYAIRR